MLKSVIKDEIKVPGHIDYLGELRNFVTKTGKKYNFSDSIVNAFKLAIDEAATNIIKHAYRDIEGVITMRILVKKRSMTVILIDQGKFFDPARVQAPDLQRYVDIGKKGGLGIFIMRKLIDEIDYRHTEEGNELRLTKYRDGDFRKMTDDDELPSASALSLSLKTRYSLFAAGILTILMSIGYIYFYFSHGQQTLNEVISAAKTNLEMIARTVVAPGDTTLNTVFINTTIHEAIDLDEHEEVYRIIITDNKDLTLFSSDDDIFGTYYQIPEDHRKVEKSVFFFEDKSSNTKLYDVVSPIRADNRQQLGEIHLQIHNDFVKDEIGALRAKDLRLAMLILAIGYFGIALLIYIVMNPFRKLSDWVKQLGHGEVQDEIDFDTGNELGEIAKAFSEITDKFRRSQENLAEQERLQKEMQLAQDIQQTLLPKHIPELEGYMISSHYEAAMEVGGDYYDFVDVDKDSIGIVVADVSGKGVPGSLIMTMIRTALRTEARGVKSASEVLARLNDFVVKDMKKGMFVTIFYVIIDSKRRRVNYASAGHNPMILYRQSTEKTYYLNPKGFPVGISLPDQELFKKSIESDTIQLAEDDILLIYTDGITEAMNSHRELFGEERLLETIRRNAELQAQPFIEKVKDEIHSFTEGFEQNDDITIVAIKEKSSPEKIELSRAQNAHQMINSTGISIKDACEEAGITTYAYYNKYKKIFEEEGIEAYSIDDTISVEAKHLSIEEKTKIYDIIKTHPEYGAKRISEELQSERYGSTVINESRIYEELVRSRLNTRQLREAYIARAGKKKRMKPPGTPMLTLDGRIILDRDYYEHYEEERPEKRAPEKLKEKKKIDAEKTAAEDSGQVAAEEISGDPNENFDEDFYIESLMTVPLENLLDKSNKKKSAPKVEKTEDEEVEEVDEKAGGDEEMVEPERQAGEEVTADDTTETESSGEVPADDNLSNEYSEIDEGDEEFIDAIEEKIIAELDEKAGQDLFDDDIEMVDHEQKKKEPDDIEEPDTQGLEEDVIDDETDLDQEFSFKDVWEDDDEGVEELSDSEDVANLDSIDEDVEMNLGNAEDSQDIMDEILNEDEITFENLAEEDNFDRSSYDKDDNNGSYEEKGKKRGKKSKKKKKSDAGDDDQKSGNEEKAEDDGFTFGTLLDEIEHDLSYIDDDIGFDEDDLVDSNKMVISGENIDIQDNIQSMDKRELDQALQNDNLLSGLKHYKNDDFEKAIDEFKKVLELYPDFKEVHTIMGNAYFKNDMSDEALKEYMRVIEIDPYDVDAYENLGVIYANQGEYTKAIEEWKKLLEIDPERGDIKDNLERAQNIIDGDKG
ncbi:MAG: SpoIIE family protein phosphatase [candidate division KSB1 bacterium]|nr:SpoIIE family protein phosphatase [candidate division KSB1 bacterium]